MLPMIPTGDGGFLRDVCGYFLTTVGHIAQAFADLADALEFDGVAEHLRASANQAFDHAEELLSSDNEGTSDRDSNTDDGVDFEDMPYMVLTVADTVDGGTDASGDVMAQHGVTPAIVTNSDGTAGTSTQLPDWYDIHSNPNGLSDAVESRLDLSGDGLLRIDCVLANTVPDAADDGDSTGEGDEGTDDDASENADGDNATYDDDADSADGKDDEADSQSDDDETANDDDETNDADDAESDESDEDDANDASAGSDADAVGYGRTMVGGEVVAGDDVVNDGSMRNREAVDTITV